MDKNVAFESSSTSVTLAEDSRREPAENEVENGNGTWVSLTRAYGRLSSSRQIFCLFCVFDFLFTFFLWIIYAQGVSIDGLDDSLSNEVAEYGITTSLFDVVIISMARVVLLLVVYGYFVNKNSHAVLFTTAISTIYLIAKAVVFEFDANDNKNGSRPVDYLLHIGSFILCWVEAWYLNVKVFPRERKVGLRSDGTKTNYGATRGTESAYSVLSFHTPPDEDSGDEEAVYRANLAYIEAAREATNKSLKFLYTEKDWSVLKEKDGILVESMQDENLGKVVRLRIVINANTSVLYSMIFGLSENLFKWNTSVVHFEVLYQVNSTTDIIYTRIGEVAGGLMSARDFVDVRHFQRIGSMFVITTTHTVSDLKPPTQGFVRGEALLSSLAVSPVEGDPDKSEFVWINTTRMRPSSIPQTLVDRGMPGYLIECAQKLKKCSEEVDDKNVSPNNNETKL